MGHSLGDGVIVLALAGALIAYLYFRFLERQRRLEIIHAERLAAMDKGIPLPELPLDPPRAPGTPSTHVPLILGIILAAFGFGLMAALRLVSPAGGNITGGRSIWPLPLPIALMGAGLILYFLLARERTDASARRGQ
jgi:hypothetical protein